MIEYLLVMSMSVESVDVKIKETIVAHYKDQWKCYEGAVEYKRMVDKRKGTIIFTKLCKEVKG